MGVAVGGLVSGRGLSEDLSEDFRLGVAYVGGLVGGPEEDLYKTRNTSYPSRG